jgi:hypothetical protein
MHDSARAQDSLSILNHDKHRRFDEFLSNQCRQIRRRFKIEALELHKSPAHRRRLPDASDIEIVFLVSAAPMSRGSSAMPHLGNAPAPRWRRSGSIEQAQIKPGTAGVDSTWCA